MYVNDFSLISYCIRFLADVNFTPYVSYQGRNFTLSERLLTQPRVVLHYVSLILLPLPKRLNLVYDFPLSKGLLDPPTTIPALLGISGMFYLALLVIKREPFVSFFLFWFLGR